MSGTDREAQDSANGNDLTAESSAGDIAMEEAALAQSEADETWNQLPRSPLLDGGEAEGFHELGADSERGSA